MHGLPTLLQELKARGYRIVHVVEAGPNNPKTATLPEQWMTRTVTRTIQDGHWPLVDVASLTFPDPERRRPTRATSASRMRVAPTNSALRASIGCAAATATSGCRRRQSGETACGSLACRWRSNCPLPMLPTSATRVSRTRPMVARRGTPTPKGPATASTVAPTPVSAPKALPPSAAPSAAPRNINPGPQPPRPPRPIGHQLQLPKPTTTLGG